MIITKKDKKLFLFIVSAIISFWFLCISVSSIISHFSSKNSANNLVNKDYQWINSSRNINSSDLQDRIILVDFWTYACINCLHMVPEIKKLEEEFGNKLTVIGVHSGKFDNEKQFENIKKAVLKYDISHLVVNDADLKIWKSFNISSWPTFVLLDPKGKIIKQYQGEVSGTIIKEDIEKLIKKYNYSLNRDELPIVLEKNKAIDRILRFPSGIEFAKDFSYKNSPKNNSLIVSNTGKNTISVISLDGETLLEIGSGNSNLEDGEIEKASFNSPRGLLFKDDILYVADTGNHAVRKVDFKSGQVTTVIGTGTKGLALAENNKATKAELASPWDLEFFPDNNHIIISNAGTHQLLKYNISEETIIPFAGSGEEELIDGKYPNNALAQPSGLSAASGNLYFVDSETSSLRSVNKEGMVETLIGKGLFNFGHKDGDKEEALMQHPVGLSADDTGIYISDTHNNIIRKFDFKTKELSDYSGSVRGDEVGNKKSTLYNEPEAMVSVLDKFYICDTNNGRIVELERKSGNSKLLDVIPKSKMPIEGLLEYLPNLAKIPTKIVKSKSEIKISFVMKDGWKINDSSPSFFNLVEVKNNQEANLIASFDGEIIKSGAIILPKLSKKNIYYLHGTVYYCEDKENALCLIKSYEQKLIPKSSGDNQIKIEFIYQ